MKEYAFIVIRHSNVTVMTELQRPFVVSGKPGGN